METLFIISSSSDHRMRRPIWTGKRFLAKRYRWWTINESIKSRCGRNFGRDELLLVHASTRLLPQNGEDEQAAVATLWRALAVRSNHRKNLAAT
jgi:hypothetical protein